MSWAGLWVFVGVGGVVVAACGPAKAPENETPSLETVCAHTASIEMKDVEKFPAGTTEESLRVGCEAYWKDFRDDESGHWSCYAPCLNGVATLPDIKACEKTCAAPSSPLDCNDVFVQAEVAKTLGVTVGDGVIPASIGFRKISADHDHCYTTMRMRPANAVDTRGLSLAVQVHQTKSAAGRWGRSSKACEVTTSVGRISLTATEEGDSACDKAALQAIVAQAAKHLDGNGRLLASSVPATAAAAPLVQGPARPPPSCPNQADPQPVFKPTPQVLGPVPSLQSMCANVAEQESVGAPPHGWAPGTTKASARKDCEEYWKGYRDTETPERWACQAQCRGAAKSYAQLERCDQTCTPVTNAFTCDCVIREDDVSAALGKPVRVMTSKHDNQVSATSKECTAYFVVDGAIEPMHVALYLHPTVEDTKRQEHGGAVDTSCMVYRALGHVFYIADGKRAGICDHAALDKVLDKVSSRIRG